MRGVAVAAAIALTIAPACASSAGSIEIAVRNSKFLPSELSVPTGARISFTLTNHDPIAHEFIIGTKAEQLAHERGSDETHDGAPGAASLEPGETQTVTHTFDSRGMYEYACHLPGHYAYGMVGTITVT